MILNRKGLLLQPQKESATSEAHEEEIKKLQQQIQKRDQATLEVIERIQKLEERLAQLRDPSHTS